MQLSTSSSTALPRPPATPLVRRVAAVAAAASQSRQPRSGIATTALEGELLQAQQRARQASDRATPPPIPGATLHAAHAISAYLSAAATQLGSEPRGRHLDLCV